ncbi:HEPN domain-containing protein [Streptomyces sp. NPDC048172]|uniref:ApeA N-terminal domain 1-containing protein n=1 Tax=Streptomyces sp. NPDC048172 TaxID=3365505 RepID=UPI003723B94B
MKKLQVSTGEYACTWSVNDGTVPGELVLAGSQRPQGSVFDAPGVWTSETDGSGSVTRRFSPHVAEFPRLRGRLRTNQDVVLLDAKVTYLFPEQARLSARMALIGLGIPEADELLFDSVEFQVGGLTEISGVRAFTEFSMPVRGGSTERQFSAAWSGEADQEWTTASGDSLSLDYIADLKYDRGYRYHLSSYPVVSIRGVPRTADEWIDTYIRPLTQITTFVTVRKQPICWARLTCGSPRYSAQVFSSEVTQEPFDAESPEPGVLAPLLRLGPGGVSLADLLSGWRSLGEDYDTFFDLLITALREAMTPKTQFLSLVPAIESYHATKYGSGPIPKKEFQRERKAVLRRLTECTAVDDGDIQWLKQWIDTVGSYPLHERMRQLAESLSPALQERIHARVDPLPAPLDTVFENPRDVWAVMAKVRNNLAHGAVRPTPPQLLSLTRLAQTLVAALVLQQLGVSDTTLVEAIDRGDWQVV